MASNKGKLKVVPITSYLRNGGLDLWLAFRQGYEDVRTSAPWSLTYSMHGDMVVERAYENGRRLCNTMKVLKLHTPVFGRQDSWCPRWVKEAWENTYYEG